SILHFSFHVNKALRNNIADLNKKRKLQAGQLDLPIPKHKCWNRSFASEHVSVFEKNPELKSIFPHIITGKTEGATVGDESETESVKDSNNFAGDCDCVMSSYEANLPLQHAKTYLFDKPSTSSDNSDSNSSKHNHHPFGSCKDKLALMIGEHPPPHNDGLQAFQNLEEQLLEICKEVDYTCSDYGNDRIEQYTDKELEDIPFSNEVNPNMFVLSSGRWSVNQDAQSSNIREPTIDQEFEQYFSKLML
ncbi:protein FAR-RED-ELONGATED HYPOCOTYL 1-LIKE-like, partial [Corylus avellana]|uniref:protein FAR-RED-ELONGATED HYPOCOTYL 1-LIKE-like n=1 Tax=Corylus avellana TaxID=13451 RepID=UPI00286AF9B0